MSFVVVTGTGTEIGKTYVSVALLRLLRADGIAVAARKPVQSFEAGDATTDADLLASATGEDPFVVCPARRRYEVAMAPPMAAHALEREPFTIADLAREITASAPPGALVLVEGAGGARAPLAADGDTTDLVRALDPALVVVVADAELGSINLVRLTVGAIPANAPRQVVVMLNRYVDGDDLHRRNRDWLRDVDGLDVVTDVDDLRDRAVARARR